jgi:hypothetical protein
MQTLLRKLRVCRGTCRGLAGRAHTRADPSSVRLERRKVSTKLGIPECMAVINIRETLHHAAPERRLSPAITRRFLLDRSIRHSCQHKMEQAL